MALGLLLLLPGNALAWDITRVTTDRMIRDVDAAVDADGHRHIVYDTGSSLVYLTDASGHWARTVLVARSVVDADIAVTPSGRAHVVVERYADGQWELTYATNGSGAWVKETVDRGPTSILSPAIAVSPRGVPHIAWSGGSGADPTVEHARRTATGDWIVAERATAWAFDVDLAIGPGGHPHIVWAGGTGGGLHWATDAGGSWASGSIAGGDVFAARIAVDKAGVSHVAYDSPTGAGGTKYATDLGGYWTRERIATSRGPLGIALDADGPVVVWAPWAGGLTLARRPAVTWQIEPILDPAIHAADPSVGLVGERQATVTWLTTDGIHGSDETAGAYPVDLIEPVLGDTFTPAIAAAPGGSLRMALAGCGGAGGGVRFGSNAGGSWTWARPVTGCARRAALDLDPGGRAHLATDGWYATDKTGSWVTTPLPALPETGNFEGGWEDIAIGGANVRRPVVVLGAVARDAGNASPNTWTWRPGDTDLGIAPGGSWPSVAVTPAGKTVIGEYDWYYDAGYLYRRPSTATMNGDTWRATPLADAGRAAAVASRPDGSLAVAFVRLGAPRGYVATGQDFPDALAASAAAVRDEGFVLLTRPTAIPSSTRSELHRLRPEHLTIAGGTAAVSAAVEAAAAPYGYSSVARAAGADRYETAASIAFGVPYDCCNPILIASGTTFPDALAGATLARQGPAALLLVTRDRVPAATARRISASRRIIILGGTGAVSSAVEAELARLVPDGSVERIYGADRYATAAAIARRAYPTGSPVAYLATGEAFPDGLVAGPAAAQEGGPLLLTRKGDLPAATRTALVRLAPERVVIVGGTGAVSNAVSQAVRAAQPGASVVRIAGADRYETAAALTRYAFPESAGLHNQDLADPSHGSTFVSPLIPDGPLDLVVAPDGTARIAFAGPDEPGIHVAASDAGGAWTVSRVTTDPRDGDPSVAVAGGRTYVAFDRGTVGIFLAAE